MKELLIIGISAAIVNNVVLSQFLGLCPFFGVSKKIETAAGMGGAVIFVITLSSFVTSLIYKYILANPHVNMQFLQTIVFILVIAALVQFVEMFLKKSMPALYQSLGVYLPLITTNCVVLGLALSVGSMTGAQWPDMLGTIIGVPLGYFIVIILFSAIRQRLDYAPVPKGFKGAAIGLIATAIMAMAFMGLGGMIG